jgi:uncharacterized integral membrane protein
MQFYLVVALIFALLVASFAIQNTALVVIRFLFWEAQLSLVLVILGSVAAGALLLFFLSLIKQYSNHREKKNLKQEKDKLLKDLNELNVKISALEAQQAAASDAIRETSDSTAKGDFAVQQTNDHLDQAQEGSNV